RYSVSFPRLRPCTGGVEDEEIEVLELPFSRALEMVRSGEIRDGKTVLLLNYLQTSHLLDGKKRNIFFYPKKT
ncbi:hypothetical protein V3C21_24960, partial [Salmonella enterica subsp. enterica serovar Paratyphi B]